MLIVVSHPHVPSRCVRPAAGTGSSSWDGVEAGGRMYTSLGTVFWRKEGSQECVRAGGMPLRRQAQSSEPTTQSFSFNTVNNTLEQGRATWVPSVLPKASPALWPHPIPVHGDNGATNTFLAAIPLAGAGSMLSHCPSQQLQHHHPKKGKIRIQKGSGLCFGAAPPPPPAAP